MGKLRNMLKRTRIGDAALVAALGTFAFGGVFVGGAASQETATSGSRALAVVAKDAGKCGALLVGVDEYETLTPLEYASSDVRKLRAALVEIGFPSETIRTFVSDGRIRERPSRARILAALDEILAASGPDSTVLIALSGHGFETEGGAAAFCPEDVVVKKNGDKTLVKSETAILIEDVAKRLRQDDAKFKLLIVDACREPASTEKGATSKTRSFPSISEARGVAFLQSCESREFSWEHSELKGGVFTHYFAEGLRGAADSDGDGGVSFLDVCNYATSQTQRFVRDKRDASQTPFYRFSGVVDFWLKPPTEDTPRNPNWLLWLSLFTGGLVVFAVGIRRSQKRMETTLDIVRESERRRVEARLAELDQKTNSLRAKHKKAQSALNRLQAERDAQEQELSKLRRKREEVQAATARAKAKLYQVGGVNVDDELCVACGACVDACPCEAIEVRGDVAVIDDNCAGCGACVDVCPCGALDLR